MSAVDVAKVMLSKVAIALDEPLLQNVAFVGGCTTGLLVTDDFSRQGVRFTDDVDLIVGVAGKAGWYQLRAQLIDSGFTESMDDEVNCRMRLAELKVDFMPDDVDALGFTNCWYKEALATATLYQLQKNLQIRVVTPPYFVATKLEAYKGRGNDDPLGSHDIEDLLTLFDGRPELLNEIATSSVTLSKYISEELRALLNRPDFEYAIQSTARNNLQREHLIFQRIEKIANDA